jgi:hypothetical protein
LAQRTDIRSPRRKRRRRGGICKRDQKANRKVRNPVCKNVGHICRQALGIFLGYIQSSIALRSVITVDLRDRTKGTPRKGILWHENRWEKLAILVADGFEQVEMTKPREALDEAGTQTKIVSLKPAKIQGMNHADKGDKFNVDLTVDQARPEQFDALLIPRGLLNPDAMRTNERAQNFARHFFRESKPVAVICHGPQLLINADLVRGRK